MYFYIHNETVANQSQQLTQMNTQSSPPINFLETVDSYIVYAIGSNVYQIEVTAEDLEEVLGVEVRKWECNYSGKFYSDNEPIYATLAEVHEADYTLLITALSAKAEDVTDSYEGPVTMIGKYKALSL